MFRTLGNWFLDGLSFLFMGNPIEAEAYVTQWRLDLTLDGNFHMRIQKSDGSLTELITHNPEYVRLFADDEGVPSPWVVDEELIRLGAIDVGGVYYHPNHPD